MQIKDWNDAEMAMKEIAEKEREAMRLRCNADEKIEKIKDELSGKLKPVIEKEAPLREALEEFCRDHMADMLPAKHKKLRFGKVCFRDEPKFSWPRVATLLARLKECRLSSYIRTEEKPDKAGIMAHYEKLPLVDLGIKRKVERDVFSIDIDKEA